VGSFTVHQRGVDAVLRSPSGAAGRDLRRRLVRVTNKAKTLCSVDTGRLRSSIVHTEPRRYAGGVRGTVGSNVVYAAAVHDPTGPHAPPSWRAHPPRARPFLRDALPAAQPTRITD
jgi:hypothetical protein